MKFWQYLAFSEPEQLVEIARHCEEAGFDGVLLGDPLFLPENLASRHPCSPGGTPGFDGGAPWPDPWVAIGAMGAVTEKLLARCEAERESLGSGNSGDSSHARHRESIEDSQAPEVAER